MGVQGRFLWYDLITTDKAAATDFYGEVMGWTLTAWQGPRSYAMWTTPAGQAIGGVVEREGVKPHWMSYVGVEDVDVACTMVEGMGGTVTTPPFDMDGVGRAAVVAGPSGAELSIFKPLSEPPEPSGAPGPGQAVWSELVTHTPEQAVTFWFKLCGWTDVNIIRLPSGRYMIYGREREDHGLGGMYRAPAGVGSHWLYYFSVADLDAALERVIQRGGAVTNGPYEVPDGARMAQCIDPQGAAFALHCRPGRRLPSASG